MEDEMNMKKNLWKKILLLFCMVLCLLGIFHQKGMIKAETGEVGASNQFDIQAETALGNVVKTGRNSQMKVTITNHEGDFQGLVQIMTNVDGDNIVNQEEFSIGSGETKIIEIPFRMQSAYNKMLVRITDENENVLKKVKIKVTLSDDYEYLNGVLTNNKQDMGYLENYTKVSWLDKDHMPDTAEGIDALDRIYINDFQTAKLSKEQYEVLKAWVEEGGDLIIGTGRNASATLGIFQDDFLKGKIGDSEEDDKAELSFEGEQVYHDAERNYNIHSVSVGKGSIWIYDIDLAVPAKEWKQTGARYIYYQLNQQFGGTGFPNTGNEDAIFAGEELNIKDASRFPNMFSYGIVFGIYILCVSFGGYFILKKLDKLEKTWVTVPVLSFLFVIVLYILGNNTRITTTYLTYSGVVRFSGEDDINPHEKSILRISSSSNQDYALAIPEGKTLYSSQGNNDDPEEDFDSYKLGFYQGKEHQYVTVKDVSAFEDNTLLSEQKRKMGKGYKSKISSNILQCDGTFTNYTGYTLKYAVLVTENMCYHLGTIKDGETIKINKKTPQLSTNINFGEFDKKMKKLMFGTNSIDDLTVEAMRYRCVFFDDCYYSFKYTGEDGYTGAIFACIDLKEDRENMGNEWGVTCDGITICDMPVKIDYKYKDESFVPNFIVDAKNVDGMIDEDRTFDYTKTQSVDLEYTLKNGDTLKGIYYLKDVNPSIGDKSNDYFSGEVMAYNYTTKKYEVIFESDKEKSIRKTSDYVNQENVLKIRVKTAKKAGKDKDAAWEQLPAISLSIKSAK